MSDQSEPQGPQESATDPSSTGESQSGGESAKDPEPTKGESWKKDGPDLETK